MSEVKKWGRVTIPTLGNRITWGEWLVSGKPLATPPRPTDHESVLYGSDTPPPEKGS